MNNCEIEYDQFYCSDCAKSLCLEIKKEMIVLEKLYNLVKTLNMNDDNEEKCYGVSTNFIRKLTDSFFITIGKKSSTKTPLRKICRNISGYTMVGRPAARLETMGFVDKLVCLVRCINKRRVFSLYG